MQLAIQVGFIIIGHRIARCRRCHALPNPRKVRRAGDERQLTVVGRASLILRGRGERLPHIHGRFPIYNT